MTDGTQVVVPPHLSPSLASSVRRGDTIDVHGRFEHAMRLVALRIDNAANGATAFDIDRISSPAAHAHVPPHPKGRDLVELSAQGTIKVTLSGPHGEMSGAVLAQSRQSNPAHFEKIQQILTGLREQPQRAEGDWLQVHFNTSDVDSSRYVLQTRNPPKQRLQCTLDDARYTMHLTRTDLSAALIPAK